MKARRFRFGAPLLALAIVGPGCASLPAPQLPLVNSQKKLQAQMAVARMQEQQGDTGSAKKFYEGVVRKHPKNAEAHQRLGVIAVRQGKPEVAEMHLTKARELAPSDNRILNDLGYFYFLEDRLDEAEAVLNQVLEDDPMNSRALNNLGLVLGFQNRPEEAFAAFRKVGTDAEAHANLAFVFAQKGELDKAQMHYSVALNHNPKMKPAARALIELARFAPGPMTSGRPIDEQPAAPEGGDDPLPQQAAAPSLLPDAVREVQTAAHLAPLDAPAALPPQYPIANANPLPADQPLAPYEPRGGFSFAPEGPGAMNVPPQLQPLPPTSE